MQQKGEPERAFAKSAHGFYNLLVDKWRVDELYEATVIGTVDALADIFTMADKWIVDGILAKLSAGLVQTFGALLRLFHTGRVQVYSASMALGMVGMGWFFVQPHARVTVDETELRQSGRVVFSAAPGLGYSFLWQGEGVNQKEFSPGMQKLEQLMQPGTTKDVKLVVKNAFGRESTTSVSITRPALNAGPSAGKLGGGKLPLPPPRPGAPPPPVGGAAPKGAAMPVAPQVRKIDPSELPPGFKREGN
jgi:NADH-quinone oxidoreductase subunit L